jgi:hypothetical protein
MFALGAAATSSALASPHWYVKKAGTFKEASTAVKVTLEASNLTLINNTGEIYTGWSCSGPFGSGTIESGGLGKIQVFVPQGGGRECKGGKLTTKAVNECGKEPSLLLEAIDLYWKTTLYVEGSEIRATLGAGGSGTPGLKYTCKGEFGEVAATCEFTTTTSAHMVNNASAGLVEAEFDAKSKRMRCSTGGSKAEEVGEWKGVLKFEPTEEEKKAGVEAIKVE